ncbi:unnamed protein product [Closterium sp. NIES-53]
MEYLVPRCPFLPAAPPAALPAAGQVGPDGPYHNLACRLFHPSPFLPPPQEAEQYLVPKKSSLQHSLQQGGEVALIAPTIKSPLFNSRFPHHPPPHHPPHETEQLEYLETEQLEYLGPKKTSLQHRLQGGEATLMVPAVNLPLPLSPLSSPQETEQLEYLGPKKISLQHRLQRGEATLMVPAINLPLPLSPLSSPQETEQLEYLVPKKTSLQHRLQQGDAGFVQFVASLLQVDPDKRPTAAQALEHPWLSHPYDPIT